MSGQLPISRAINVQVSMTPPAAQAQSLSNLLFLGTSTVIDPVERYRSYGTLAAVASDFGTTAEEYKAANRWFSQTPQPTNMLIGRFAMTAARGGLRGAPLSVAQQQMSAWTGITTGAFKISKDGGAAVQVSGINFSTVTSMAQVAAAIQAGTGMPAGVTVAWNPTYSRFEFESTTAGPTSSIAFLTAPTAGVDITGNILGRSTDSGAYVYQGIAAETATQALTLFEDMVGMQFYGVGIGGLVPGANAGADNTALLAAAGFIEAATNKHILALTTQEGGALSAVSTTDLPAQLKALGYKRTMTQYSSSSQHAVLSALARILSVDYEQSGSAITLKFKQEPGIVAEALTTTQADALKGKNCNVFAAFSNNTNILLEGVMASGNYVDEITGTDWLAVTVQRDLFNALYSNNTKIPQTDAGMQVLTAVVSARCAQGVNNGLIAPGVWNSGGFGTLKQGDYLDKGFYIFAAPIAQQAQADRVARKAVPIQVAVKLAGAVHSVDCTINVNQ